MSKKQLNNVEVTGINSLMTDLQSLYSELRNGQIKPTLAKDAANVAGKLINASRVKIEYNKITKQETKIDFLEN